VLQTLTTTVYRVVDGGNYRSCVILEEDQTWPTSKTGVADAVRVTFDCGYEDLTSPANNPIPEPVKQAILMLAQSLYDRPGMEDVPQVVHSLVSSYKVAYFGGIHG
jgi:hypothetical protein